MKVALVVLALVAAALAANTLVVDSRTRPAMARGGGEFPNQQRAHRVACLCN
jgi:hypothetical protein